MGDYRDGRVDITGKERACAENKPTNEFESQRCICKWINMHQPHNGINKTILNFMHNNAAPDLQFSQFLKQAKYSHQNSMAINQAHWFLYSSPAEGSVYFLNVLLLPRLGTAGTQSHISQWVGALALDNCHFFHFFSTPRIVLTRPWNLVFFPDKWKQLLVRKIPAVESMGRNGNKWVALSKHILRNLKYTVDSTHFL